jgi:hypothetical protein
MQNCWPYDEPVRMANGCYITGGQDKDGLPVVAVSRGCDFLHWNSVLVPYPKELDPSVAETTVWAEGDLVLAVIRGGRAVAWVSESRDYGKTWTMAQPSNFPMPSGEGLLGEVEQRAVIPAIELQEPGHALHFGRAAGGL